MQEIREQFLIDLEKVDDEQALIELKNQYFSKKGIITKCMEDIKYVEDKKAYGQQVNELKDELYSLYTKKEQAFKQVKLDAKLKKQVIDVTMPASQHVVGRANILLQTKREIEDFFASKGFELAVGSEIETDFFNFSALNLPEDHPARDMQDTFYINNELLLRTHTSNIQSRLLTNFPNQELKFICSGKVYRRDDDDATHSHQFMQLEGFNIVDKRLGHHANMQDLKSLLEQFVKTIFNDDSLQVRLRPSFFPFTEPSFEVDVTCSKCHGSGCGFCKHTGWIEILGAGIVDQAVLAIANVDPKYFTGYAFGIGIERICLLKYNIDDIRQLYLNDYRFLNQF